MNKTYPINIVGLERHLPICKIADDLCIAGFVIFGDPEMTVEAAKALLKKAPQYDVLITAEAKGIPLVHEMARQNGDLKYVVARKAMKLYMQDPFNVEVQSITTAAKQQLFVDNTDAEYMKGKKILIIDDVISTGESLRAVEKLVKVAGGNVVGKMAILAEGDAKYREDIVTLAYLPLLNGEGEPLG